MNTRKTPLTLTLIASSLYLATANAESDTKIVDSSSKAEYSIFSQYESNGLDSIYSFGTGVTLVNPNSHLGFGFTTSLGQGEVLSTDGYLEDYFKWEGSFKAGYFSTFSLFVEVGVDITELIFEDWRNDSYYSDSYHYHNEQDVFIGLGAGVKLGGLGVDFISRLRHIDSDHWQADNEVFTGLQLSINF